MEKENEAVTCELSLSLCSDGLYLKGGSGIFRWVHSEISLIRNRQSLFIITVHSL